MLIKQLSQSVWRRSSFGSYVLLKFVNGRPQTHNLVTLKPNSVVRKWRLRSSDHRLRWMLIFQKDELDQNQYLRYVAWAPQGNAIAFVDYNNNLHYRWDLLISVCSQLTITSDTQRRLQISNWREWMGSGENSSLKSITGINRTCWFIPRIR